LKKAAEERRKAEKKLIIEHALTVSTYERNIGILGCGM